MEGFKSFTQAVDYAAERCSSWAGIQDGSTFGYKDMMGVSLVVDAASPMEEPFWYVVFPDGEIDYLCTETGEIEKMFIAENSTPVPAGERIGFGDESSIPDDLIADVSKISGKKAPKFCRFCGNALEEDSMFCSSCGKKL